MTNVRLSLKTLTLLVFICALASVANAQASRTWVSGVGDDVNPCSRTAPCKTWAGAISKTAANGEINALDPGGFGTLTITKSITVNGIGTNASTLNSGLNAFTINYDSFGADVRKSVRIRNVNTQGFDSGTGGIRILGAASSGSEVLIESVFIDGNNAAPGRGINDNRTGGGTLFVNDVTISNCSGTGIAIAPTTGSTRIDATIINTRIYNCLFGVVASSGSRVTVNNTTASHCTTGAGFAAESPNGGTSELNVSNSVTSGNSIGVQQFVNGTIRIGNSDISHNTTAVSGTVLSYGNNRVSGGAGALTPIGADTHDKGQQ
jgi:hypothetical protein